jgi:hypothetical protein
MQRGRPSAGPLRQLSTSGQGWVLKMRNNPLTFCAGKGHQDNRCLRGPGMATYRAYLVDNEGHFKGVQVLEECSTDQEAIEVARQYVDGCGVEVWNLDRLVVALPASKD